MLLWLNYLANLVPTICSIVLHNIQVREMGLYFT